MYLLKRAAIFADVNLINYFVLGQTAGH